MTVCHTPVISQGIVEILIERRTGLTYVRRQTEELTLIQIVPPYHMPVLIVLSLDFVDVLAGRRRKPRKSKGGIWTGSRGGGDPKGSDRVQKQPGQVIRVVDLVVRPKICLVALALIVKDGMSRRGRIEPSIGPERAVEDIKSELVAARPTILE